jgi:hypothetical protein
VIANEAYSPASHPASKQQIPCYDPGNMQFLGLMAADSAEQARRARRRRPCASAIVSADCRPAAQVAAKIGRARAAAKVRKHAPCGPGAVRALWRLREDRAPVVRVRSGTPVSRTQLCGPQVWRRSSFRQRRLLLRVLLKYIVDNQETICRCLPRCLPARHRQGRREGSRLRLPNALAARTCGAPAAGRCSEQRQEEHRVLCLAADMRGAFMSGGWPAAARGGAVVGHGRASGRPGRA